MLNKLYYFKNFQRASASDNGSGASSKDIINAFVSYCAENGVNVELFPSENGTLGVTFMARGLPEGPCFIKSHLPGTIYRDALKKETELLQIANADALHIKTISLLVHEQEQFYLQMDILKDIDGLRPDDVRTIIRQYQTKFSIKPPPTCYMYEIDEMCAAALAELEVLRSYGFLTKKCYFAAKDKLLLLQEESQKLPRCICHGDLSDRNIMRNAAGRPVVIDWEDAFWGCNGYDYLYWLTFFNHRKFYSKEHIFSEGLDAAQVDSIFTMILVLKSAISFYSCSYRTNSMSMEDRLLEIWEFCRG